MENKIYKILKVIVNKLSNVDYAFMGSVNLYVQGLKVQPRDIDILTTKEDIKVIDDTLKKYRTKEIYFDESDGRNSFRSLYEIDGMEIEVLGNVNNLFREPDSLKRKIFIKYNNIEIPCIKLSDELETYIKLGRKEKVKMIQDYMKNGKLNETK